MVSVMAEYLFHLLLIMACIHRDTEAVAIKSIKVPPAVENGTAPVILDCDYSLPTNERQGLVVQWFLRNDSYPVYQWIPGKPPKDLGALRGRLNLEYRASEDPYLRHRALAIIKPTTELSGEYRCKVATFENEDTAASTMVVYVPADSLTIQQTKPSLSTVNVTCRVEGIYPEPRLELVQEDQPHGNRQQIKGGILLPTSRNGRYDVTLYKVLEDRHLEGETTFECMLSLPGTEYLISKKMTYFPGPPSSVLPPQVNDLDEESVHGDPGTSAPSVSAPHRSESHDSDNDDQNSNEDDVWESTGRGIRAHDFVKVLSDNGASFNSPLIPTTLFAVIVAKLLC